MTDTTNITAVRRFLELQYQGDIEEAFRRYAHPDFRWVVSTRDHDELREAIPWAGYTHEGRQGYERLVGQLFSEFESLEFSPKDFIDAGDRVFVEGRFVFRHRQTARLAVSDFLGRFDLRQGRIAGGQFYENTAAVADARRAE
ncbi:MAG: nuclear transport factor 2 family protein [Myxococcota bacterium]